jgi:diacylglycerol kinase
MRIHAGLACVVVLAIAWLDLPVAETGVLVLAVVGVLACEVMNTAIETVVDLQVGDNHHELAGRAKDLSAAAVLLTAAGAAVVGLIVLLPPVAFAVGAGGIDAVTIGRAATLVAVLGFVGAVLRKLGRRPAGGHRTS